MSPRSSARYETGAFPPAMIVGGQRLKTRISAAGLHIGCTFISKAVLSDLVARIDAAADEDEE